MVIHKNTANNKWWKGPFRNQNPPTFSSDNVKWEQPGHKTAGSFLQNLNRSYHGIWPSQCWDSAGGEQIIQKDTYTPQCSLHQYLSQSKAACTHKSIFKDGWICGTHTQANTHIYIHTHTFTGTWCSNQKACKMSFPATWMDMLMKSEGSQQRNNCLRKLHWVQSKNWHQCSHLSNEFCKLEVWD